MNVELLRTDGTGLEAEVVVNGEKLTVMDAFSPPLAPIGPGQLRNAEFCANVFTEQTWEDIFSGNPGNLKMLKHVHGWTYEGYGQITAINPTVIDFGVLTLETGPPTHDERCIGEFVRLVIDRLDLCAKFSTGE